MALGGDPDGPGREERVLRPTVQQGGDGLVGQIEPVPVSTTMPKASLRLIAPRTSVIEDPAGVLTSVVEDPPPT